ncbi:MAG: exonuclease, partial [Oscillospiraceae bacterium]|nr:exonuclease [Oscillospiraceae bacterium]
VPEVLVAARAMNKGAQLLKPLLDRGVLCAHNATFDLGVLGKCLRDYGIVWKPTGEYVCTYQIGSRLLNDVPNHKLNTLAERLGLPLQHHNALSDTKACAGLLQYYRQQVNLTQFHKQYDFIKLKTIPVR